MQMHATRILALSFAMGFTVPHAAGTEPADGPPTAVQAPPDIARFDAAERLGNILFWAGQAKLLAFAGGYSTGALAVFTALYGAQEAGLGLNYYANRSLFRTYEGLGGESSFLRKGARKLYLADKALTVASLGSIAYGAASDNSSLAVAGGVGFLFSNLLDFYVWHQLTQSNGEARSAVLSWNAGAGLHDGGMRATITYSFR